MHLKEILSLLRQNELYAKLKKSEFWLDTMSFLGHVVSKDGVVVDPQKIKVVIECARSRTPTEVRSFLGLIGYYCRFVANFSRIAIPLTNLIKKTTNF